MVVTQLYHEKSVWYSCGSSPEFLTIFYFYQLESLVHSFENLSMGWALQGNNASPQSIWSILLNAVVKMTIAIVKVSGIQVCICALHIRKMRSTGCCYSLEGFERVERCRQFTNWSLHNIPWLPESWRSSSIAMQLIILVHLLPPLYSSGYTWELRKRSIAF